MPDKKPKLILLSMVLFLLIACSCSTGRKKDDDSRDKLESDVSASSIFNSKSKSDPSNAKIPKELVGEWEYYNNAGSSGQCMIGLELKSNGSFYYIMGLATRAGSGITETKYAMGASCEGKYKTEGANIIILYDAVGGKCEEKSSTDNLYELIERSQTSNDIKVKKKVFLYSLEIKDGETVLTFREPQETDPDALTLKVLHDSPMKRKADSTGANKGGGEASSESGVIDDPLADLKKAELSNYPGDVIPVYKNGIIFSVTSGMRNNVKVFRAMVAFDADLDILVKYYKEKLSDAEDCKHESYSDIHTFTGIRKGYKFTASLTSQSDKKNASVMTVEMVEVPSVSSLLAYLNVAGMPEGYPKDSFPPLDGGALNNLLESEFDGKTSYYMTVYSDKSFKEVIDFYVSRLGKIEDKSLSTYTEGFDLSGTAKGYYFYISGYKSEENDIELTRYSISLDPVR